MIGIADKSDIQCLKNLWCEVFDEDTEVCDIFFENIFKTCVSPVFRVNGKIVSSVFLLECNLNDARGFYVYCAMTKKDFRGKGYMGELLKFSDKIREDAGLDFLLLVPSEKSLFNYYSKFGFAPYCEKQTRKFDSFNGNIRDVKSVSSKEYIAERNRILKGADKLYFPTQTVEYWLLSCMHYGGETVTCGEGFAVILPFENTVKICDAYGSSTEIFKIAEYANYKFKAKKIIAEGIIGNNKESDEISPYAMIKTDKNDLKNRNFYIGITLE